MGRCWIHSIKWNFFMTCSSGYEIIKNIIGSLHDILCAAPKKVVAAIFTWGAVRGKTSCTYLDIYSYGSLIQSWLLSPIFSTLRERMSSIYALLQSSTRHHLWLMPYFGAIWLGTERVVRAFTYWVPAVS